MDWTLTDAKNRLRELVNRVLAEGPQTIRRRHDAFVVMTEREYLELTGARPTFKQMLFDGPSLEGGEFQRGDSTSRRFEW